MKNSIVSSFFFLITLALSAQVNQNSVKADVGKSKIAILGMFHFGATSDLAAIVLDSVKGERRQKEIQQLLDHLEAFKPTKVLVEYPMKRQDSLQARYSRFQAKNFDLPASETYQVGFRLANRLQHDSIYAIDHKLDMPFEDLVKYCQENDAMEMFQAIVALAQSFTSEETKVLQTTALPAFLKRMNNDEADRFGNALYLRETLKIGDPENEVGAKVSGVWYQRNMIILKNIMNTIQSPEERILVIIGAAHRAVLKDYVNNLEEIDFVEIGDYLH